MTESINITGLRVVLDEKDCCGPHAIVARADGACSGFELLCSKCNSRRGSLSKAAADFLRSTVRLFGTLSEPVYITSAMNGDVKMKRDDLFPRRYFKAADLNGKPIDVTIKSATVEALKNMQGVNEDKLVLGFANQKMYLVVNRTNYDSIAELHGDDTDGWVGKRVQLYPDKASVGGKRVDAVRVRAPIGDALNDTIPI
jgi:hypothetical protein